MTTIQVYRDWDGDIALVTDGLMYNFFAEDAPEKEWLELGRAIALDRDFWRGTPAKYDLFTTLLATLEV